MTAQSAIPLKWYVPFANGDSSRVELPITTSDPTRASQTLGFPPLTMQPPESGGVPPQGEDFNGGMNQVARICWWVLNGGGWPFDATFAANSNINGYPNGAIVQAADFRGEWLSVTDNNQNNPDTGSGAAWVPGFQYGTTSVTGLTGGTVTLTPAQAAKYKISLSGTLTSALIIVMPTWTQRWQFVNSTTGGYTVIVKTASGAGVTLQGGYQYVEGNGTDIIQPPFSIAAAATSTQPPTMSQAAGVVGNARRLAATLATAGTSITYTADEIIVESALGGIRQCLTSFSQTLNGATTGLGGLDTGALAASTFYAFYAAYTSSGAKGIFAQAEPVGGATSVYQGSFLPSGVVATALIGVWPTNGSAQFVAGYQRGAKFSYQTAPNSLTAGSATSITLVNVATLIPKCATEFSLGIAALTASTASNGAVTATSYVEVASGAARGQTGVQGVYSAAVNTVSVGGPVVTLPNQGQQYYYATVISSGTSPAVTHTIPDYKIPTAGE